MRNFKKNQLSDKELQNVKGGGSLMPLICETQGGVWLGDRCAYDN